MIYQPLVCLDLLWAHARLVPIGQETGLRLLRSPIVRTVVVSVSGVTTAGAAVSSTVNSSGSAMLARSPYVFC